MPSRIFLGSPTSTAATATGGVTFPSFQAQGSGSQTETATGAVSFPHLTAQGTGNEAPNGIAAITFPSLDAQGSGSELLPTATGAATFPHLTVQGLGFAPVTGSGTIAFPAFIASSPDARAHGGHIGGQHFVGHSRDIVFPHFAAQGTGTKALINVGAVTFPHFTAQGSGVSYPNGVGVIAFPHFRMEGALGAQNPAGTSVITFPHFMAQGGDPMGIGIVSFPAFMAQGYAESPTGVGIGVITLPAFRIQGTQSFVSPVIVFTSTGPRLATAYIHSPWYPRERLGVLTTANNIDRSFTAVSRLGTKDTGQGALHISTREPALLRDSGILTHGNLLVITSPVVAPWVGVLVTTQEDDTTGQIELSAISYEAVLDARVTPQTQKWTKSVGANAIFNSLIDEANARNHLGLIRPAVTEITNPVEDLEVGGQSVLEALNELAGRTDSEWWLDYQVSPQYIKAMVRLGFAQGLDLSARKHYYQGTHFTAQFKADMSQVKQSVTTVGDFGADLPDRNSVTKVASFGPQHLGIQTAAIHEAATAAARRLTALPAGLRNEKINFEVMTGKTGELSRRSAVVQERPLQAERTFNATFYSNVDWRDLAAGNIVSLWGTWGGVTGQHVVRVMGLQPDEEQGVAIASCWEPVA